MSAVGQPGGFANVGRGRYATRPGRDRWVIANHLLVEKAQTRAQMLHQWDQRTCTDARQIGGVRAGSNRRLGKIRRCDPNRPRPSVWQRDNDVGGTAPRPLLQHLKPAPKKKMMRVSDRDVRHDPLKNRGTLACSAIPLSAMRFWIASFTTPIASNSKATACAGAPAKRKRPEPPRPNPSSMPPCSGLSRPSPSGGREDAASLDSPCARRLRALAVGTEECSRRGSNKRMDRQNRNATLMLTVPPATIPSRLLSP
jgi:hypothetical protein